MPGAGCEGDGPHADWCSACSWPINRLNMKLATPCTQPTHMHGVAAMPAALTREDHARSGTTVGPCCRWACTTPQGLARLRTNVTTVLERAQEAHPINSYAMDARKLDGLRDTCQPCRNAQLASARGSTGALLAAPQPGYMRVPRPCPHITLSWPSSCPIVRLSALQAHSADRHAAALSVRHAVFEDAGALPQMCSSQRGQ